MPRRTASRDFWRWALAVMSRSHFARKRCGRNWNVLWGYPVTDMAIRAALSTAVADVLERMFFLEALGEADEPPANSGMVAVQLSFGGAPRGAFGMRLARGAGGSFSADFLGEDAESLTGEQSADV